MANASNPNTVQEMGEVQAAARTLGLDVVALEIRRPEDIAPAFETLKGRAQALYVAGDPLLVANRVRIITLALAARLPTIYSQRDYVEAGGLMSYGPNFPDLFRRAADFVDKILRGAKPADIPVEQPTKFDLVINLKTAKALGLDSAADAARPRRRGDRIAALFAAVLSDAIGPSRQFAVLRTTVAFGGSGHRATVGRSRTLSRMTRMYGPAVRCKWILSSWRYAVLHQCIRPLIGAFRLLAIMDISARAISLADRPQRAIRVTSVRMRREDRTSISSRPLADLGR